MREEEIRGLFYVFWLQMFDWSHFILQYLSESFIDMYLFTWAQLKICQNCMTNFFLLFLFNYSPYPIETLQHKEAKGAISVLSTIWILLFFGIYKNIVWFYFLFFRILLFFPSAHALPKIFSFFFRYVRYMYHFQSRLKMEASPKSCLIPQFQSVLSQGRAIFT